MYENIYNILSFYFIFFDDSFFLLNFGSWYFFTVQDMNEVCGDIGFPVLKEHPLPLLTPSSPTHPASLPNSTHWNRMNLKKPTSPQNQRVFFPVHVTVREISFSFFFFVCASVAKKIVVSSFIGPRCLSVWFPPLEVKLQLWSTAVEYLTFQVKSDLWIT